MPRETNFDRVAAEYDTTRGGAERARHVAADLAEHLPSGDVLEIGVGTGIVAEALAAAAPQVARTAGIDISAGMLDRARDRLPGRLVRGSAQRLPFAPGTFDGIVAVHVLHLVPDVAATLAEASRVLRPGGRLVALHGMPEVTDDDVSRATARLRTWRERRDSADRVVALGAEVGLGCLLQRPARPRDTGASPAQVIGLIESRSWSQLWNCTPTQWTEWVEPVLAALRALPDQDRPRDQQSWMTVTVLTKQG